MNVSTLCKELGVEFGVMLKGIEPVADELDVELKRFRPMTKITATLEADIRDIFKDRDNPDYTSVVAGDETMGAHAPRTAPGKAAPEKKPTTPWKPSKLLEIPERLKDPGFVYRWCDKDKPGNIRKKQSEGWAIDTKLSRKMNNMLNTTVEDGSPVDTTTGIRELVVMKMPKEMADARNKYYQNRNEAKTKSDQSGFADEMHGLGGDTFGEVSERRGA